MENFVKASSQRVDGRPRFPSCLQATFGSRFVKRFQDTGLAGHVQSMQFDVQVEALIGRVNVPNPPRGWEVAGGWARGLGQEGGSLPSIMGAVRVEEAGGKGFQSSMAQQGRPSVRRADATECWRRRGVCRAFACARSLTKLVAS